MKRAFTYSRYSSALQNQQSIERQQENIGRFCDRNDFTVIKQYTDEAKTGKTIAGRRDFKRMLKDARAGGCDVIVVEDWKRFGRNMRESMTMFWEMEDADVDVVSSVGDNHPLMRMFGMYQAEADNVERGRITRDNMKLSVSKGVAIGVPPFGYKKVPIVKDESGNKTGGNLIINEDERKATESIFKFYLDGLGTSRVTDKLNALGIKPRRSSKWLTSSVRDILRNPVYTGSLVFLKKGNKPDDWMWVHDQHPAYVSMDDWKYIQSRMDDNDTANNKGKPATGLHLLSKFIYCGSCGSTFSHNARKHEKDVYICSSVRYGNRSNCPSSPRLNARRLEAATLELLANEILSESAMSEFLKNQSNEDAYEEQRQSLKDAIKETEQGIINLTDALRKMGHSAATGIALAKEEDRLESLQSELKKLPDNKPITKKQASDIRKACLSALQDGEPGHIRRVISNCDLSLTTSNRFITIKARHPYIQSEPLTTYRIEIEPFIRRTNSVF